MTKRHVVALTVVIMSVLVSAPAGATGDCRNLAAAPSVKTQLRAAYLDAHGARTPVKGPLPGSTYYGRCGTTRWAAATFSRPRVGTTDQPETFRRLRGHRWRDRGDDGAFCKVPRALVAIWRLQKYRSYYC
jgi:hypothetical protein